MGNQVLIICFVVVVIGGIGSVTGALIAALAIGFVDTFGKVFLPDYSGMLVYLLMAVSLWTSLPLAVFASALLALVIGALALRTRGVYFIMVTLAFSQMVYFVFHDTKLAGGSDGTYLYVKPKANLGAWSLNLGDSAQFYYAMLVLL